MYKTGSSPRNINMKSPIYIISTITASDFISRSMLPSQLFAFTGDATV